MLPLLALLAALAAAVPSVRAQPPASSEPAAAPPRTYVATIAPIGMILRELADGRADVEVLLGPGASPHTFDPRPSDARMTESGAALFFVHASLDGWAASLPAARRVEVFALLPEGERLSYATGHDHAGHDHAGHDHAGHDHDHDHEAGEPDPHFWTDPLAVRALLPALVGELVALDPDGAERYAANAASFDARLAALHDDLATLLAPARGRAIVLFHPSFAYLARRHGLRIATVVEPTPGQEPSARRLMEMIETVKREQAIAVFLEPQLPPQSGLAVAEGAGVPLSLLDPNGGVPGRSTYAELLYFNARQVVEALP